jgi:hypothetical protein
MQTTHRPPGVIVGHPSDFTAAVIEMDASRGLLPDVQVLGWLTTTDVLDDANRRWNVAARWFRRGGRFVPAEIAVRSGSWVPSGITSGPSGRDQPVTAQAVRELPLGSIVAEMQAAIAEHLGSLPNAMKEIWTDDDDVIEVPYTERERQVFQDAAVSFGAGRGKRLTAPLLEAVAASYRIAWEAGRPVTAAVAEATHCSPSTAGKRIMKARKAGLLEGIGG